MAHRTFANIRFQKNASSEFHLFLKDENSGKLEFFISTDIAINGYFKYGDLKKDFCQKFEISHDEFEHFFTQKMDIDLSEFLQGGSNSIAEVRVDEVFFQNNSRQTEQFVWISKEELNDKLPDLASDHDQVLQALLQEYALENLPADLRQSIYVLQQAHERNKLVIFSGAGVSRDSGLPLWGEMKTEMLDLFDPLIDSNTDPTLIAQYLYNARGSKEYKDRLLELLGYYKNPQANEIHRAIAKLRPQHIITTNFDDLLEKALPDPAPYSIIREDGDFPRSNLSRFLVKMHGDWNRLNFVFREDDYLNYSRKRPLTENFVKSIFASHVVLFVGFSFDDRNLKQILDWVKDILGEDFQPVYLFSVKEMNEHERVYFKNRGVHLVGWAEGYSRILVKLGQKPANMPSEIGAKTADFINFLSENNYRKYEYLRKSKSQSILDQLYDAVYVFHAFNSLPPQIFEQLFPFSPYRLSDSKVQEDAKPGLDYLETGNASIIQLMRSIEFKGNQILVKNNGVLRDEIFSVKGFKKKLWYIFEKLISSNIYCIHRKDDLREIIHYRIALNSPFSEKLLFSKWAHLQFDVLLEAIQKREYSFGQPDLIPNPLRDGLLDGYVLYRMCFYAEAYEVFQKLEFEARRAGDFALFFLSQRNRKKVGKLVHWHSRLGDYSKEYGKTVKKEVDSIDLNETLRSIQVENEVQKLLDEIESDKIIQRSLIEIEEKFIKIIGTYELYKSDYSSHWGAVYPSYLKWEFENLSWFYNSNGLIEDDDRSFRKAAEKTFEALVASYQTSKRYESRYSGFHVNILLLCLSWLEQQTLKKILKQYKLKEFGFAEGHKKDFVKQALNFFKSGFVEDTSFGSTSENRLYQEYLQRNAVYEGFLDRHFFPNLLQVLSLTDLSEIPPDLATNLCQAVLTSQRFFPKWMADVANFIPFYAQHLQLFSKPQIQMILDLTANDQTIRFCTLSPLREKLLQFHPDFRISYFGFWEKLLKRESDRNLKMEHLDTLFHFREFLEPDQTEQLREFIRSRLVTKLDFDILLLYLDSLIFELIAKEEFLPTIHGFIRNKFKAISNIQFKSDGELVPHKHIHGIPEIPGNEYWLTNSLAKLNFKHGLHEKILSWLLEQPDLPLSLRWLLNPRDFDYSKFDYHWLFFIESENLIFEKLQTMKIKKLKDSIQRGLKSQFSEKLSKIYFEHF